MDLPSYQERCGFTLWRMERTEKDHPLLEEREPELRQLVPLYRIEIHVLFVCYKYAPTYPISVSRIPTSETTT